MKNPELAPTSIISQEYTPSNLSVFMGDGKDLTEEIFSGKEEPKGLKKIVNKIVKNIKKDLADTEELVSGCEDCSEILNLYNQALKTYMGAHEHIYKHIETDEQDVLLKPLTTILVDGMDTIKDKIKKLETEPAPVHIETLTTEEIQKGLAESFGTNKVSTKDKKTPEKNKTSAARDVIVTQPQENIFEKDVNVSRLEKSQSILSDLEDHINMMTEEMFVFQEEGNAGTNESRFENDLEELKDMISEAIEKVLKIKNKESRSKIISEIKEIFLAQTHKINDYLKNRKTVIKNSLNIENLYTTFKTFIIDVEELEKSLSKKTKKESVVIPEKKQIQSIENMFDLSVFFNDTFKDLEMTNEDIDPLITNIEKVLREEYVSAIKNQKSLSSFKKSVEAILKTLADDFGFYKDESVDIIGNKIHEDEETKIDFLYELYDLFEELYASIEEKEEVSETKGLSNKEMRRMHEDADTEEAPPAGRHEKFVSKKNRNKLIKDKKVLPKIAGGIPGMNENVDENINHNTGVIKEGFTDDTESLRVNRRANKKTEVVPNEITNVLENTDKKELSDIELLQSILNESDETVHIDTEIRDDNEFNIWIGKMAKNIHKKDFHHKETLEGWYTVYTEQKESIRRIKDLTKDKKVSDMFFAEFTTPELKAFAEKRMFDELEWDLFVNKKEVGDRIIKIEQIKKSCEQKVDQIKKLEEEKIAIENSLKNKDLRISGDLVFNILHGQGAEKEKVSDFVQFLEDMSNNYTYYLGSFKNINKPGTTREMFRLYEQTRKNTQNNNGHQSRKINFWNRLVGRARRWRDDKYPNYEDMRAFEYTIEKMQDLGIVPTNEYQVEEIHNNMIKLEAFTKKAEEAITKPGVTLEDFLQTQDDENESKKMFVAMFETYINNRGRHSSFQKQARESDKKDVAFTSINNRIDQAKTEIVHEDSRLKTHIQDENFDSFVNETKEDFLLSELNSAITELRGNKNMNIKTLDSIAKKLKETEEGVSSDEAILTQRRVSLELAQAYTRIVSNRKESVLAPKSMEYYRLILQSSEIEIPKTEKKKYIEEILKLLKEELPKKQKILEKLEIEKFIKYFEEAQKTLS